MNLNLKKGKWYRQGAELNYFFASIPYEMAIKVIGLNSAVCYTEKNKNVAMWNIETCLHLSGKHIKKQIKNSRYISNLVMKWKYYANQISRFERILSAKKIKELSNKELILKLNQYAELLKKAWGPSLIIEIFDPTSETICNNYLKKNKSKIRLNDFKILCTDIKLSLLQKQKLSLLKIAKKIKLNKNYNSLLKKHTQNFFWIENSWNSTKILTEKDFMNKAKEIIDDKIDIGAEIYSLKKPSIIKKQKELKKKFKLNKELKSIALFFRDLLYLRELRKERTLITNHYLSLFVKEISKRTKISEKLIYFADMREIKIPFNKKFVSILRKRIKSTVANIDEVGNLKFIQGKEANKLIKYLKKLISSKSEIIYGSVANVGKVQGRAKIIVSREDMKKFNKGDILITFATRPELLPVMKKASAIITDEGGMTCHAAIVSRELDIPCIVGTQVAVDDVKDNDLVEVNANHGFIKILGK